MKIWKVVAVIVVLGVPLFLIGQMIGGNTCKVAHSEERIQYQGFILKEAGLQTPESVLHDAEADVYLVSNINGAPTDADGNGFISRISPDGEILELKWIDGLAENVTLNAPKGMAVTGDKLYVSDITVVRIFDRNTGEPKGEIPIPGGTFVNDLCADDDGEVFVSDTQAGAVYRITPDSEVVEVAKGKDLNSPNGLTVTDKGIVMVPFGGNEVFRFGEGGKMTILARAPAGGLDGVEAANDGRLLFSSWEGSMVYALDTDGTVSTLFDNLPAPADIGYDKKRDLILIPLFKDNKVIVKPAGSE